MMKIEAGKYYKTRDGRKVGPMSYHDVTAYDTDELLRSGFVSGSYRLYRATTGHHLLGNEELDIVSEWHDGPVRTVTRREIVPGVYGRVCVVTGVDGDGETSIKLTDRVGSPHGLTMALNAEELREAAHILNQLAEALDDKP